MFDCGIEPNLVVSTTRGQDKGSYRTSKRDECGHYNVIQNNVKAINMIPKMNKSSEMICHLLDENLLHNLTRVNGYPHHTRSLIQGESRVAEQACRNFQVVDVENDEKYFHRGRKGPKMNKSSEITCHLIDENWLHKLTRMNRYLHRRRSLIQEESRVAEKPCRNFQVVDVENDEKYFHRGRKGQHVQLHHSTIQRTRVQGKGQHF